MKENRYSIGKVEKICKINKKTLRFYDQIGLLSPSEINESGYRYYNDTKMHLIPVIKYFKQSGFTLDEIKKAVNGANLADLDKIFANKLTSLEEQEREILLKKRCLEDWYSLLKEANLVIDYKLDEVKLKFLEETEMVFLDQEYDYDYKKSVINIDFTNYIDDIKNVITGPVILEFQNFVEKIEGNSKKVRVLQRCLKKCSDENMAKYGGFLVASVYHIGSHLNIQQTYVKLKKWLDQYNYKYDGQCFERYVIDYWTTTDETKYVVEIMVKIKNKK